MNVTTYLFPPRVRIYLKSHKFLKIRHNGLCITPQNENFFSYLASTEVSHVYDSFMLKLSKKSLTSHFLHLLKIDMTSSAMPHIYLLKQKRRNKFININKSWIFANNDYIALNMPLRI